MRRAAEVGVFAALALGVLAFGGTEPLYFSLVQVVLLGLCILLVLRADSTLTESKPPWLLPAALAALLLLQSAALSIAPHTTRGHLLLFLSYLAGFYLAAVICLESPARRRLVLALLALGAFEAVYGLVQYLTGWQKIFGYTKVFNLQEVTGTYINRNHFAGLLEMLLPFALVLAFYQFGKLREASHARLDSLAAVFGHPEAQKGILWLLLAVVLFVALVFSRSRMGLLATLFSLAVMLAVAAASGRQRRLGIGLALAFLTVGVLLALWIGPAPVLARFETLGDEQALSAEPRWVIWQDTLRLINQRPWLGSGLGTFPIAYPSVQGAYLTLFVNHAHNDYLELFSDLGLPGGVLLFAGIFYLLARTLRFWSAAQDRLSRLLALGCAGSLTALLLHALTDFNFYIPANALTFAVIAGLAWAVIPPQVRKEATR
jgi:O-antigen ligase